KSCPTRLDASAASRTSPMPSHFWLVRSPTTSTARTCASTAATSPPSIRQGGTMTHSINRFAALAVIAFPFSAAAQPLAGGAMPKTLTYELYDAFQRVELPRWDKVIEKDVRINSSAGYGMQGLQLLKDWAAAFAELAYRIDLVDEHLALDEHGDGRG